jgi:hypothetical protein
MTRKDHELDNAVWENFWTCDSLAYRVQLLAFGKPSEGSELVVLKFNDRLPSGSAGKVLPYRLAGSLHE